ncbi:MAG: hypothetical protein AAF675_11660 [Pseudomonadota bacterium]
MVGSAAALSIAQEAAADLSGLRIEVSRDVGFAPFGVIFQARGLAEDVLMHGEFLWQFDDDYSFAGVDWALRPSIDAGRARGPAAAHVFPRPGTYRVRLSVSTTGGTTGAEIIVRVLRPDRLLGGQRTLYYSATGRFDGVPARAPRFTDLQEALAAARALPPIEGTAGGPRARVLLRAGETSVLQTSLSIGGIILDRFGDGPDPILLPDPETFIGPSTDFLHRRALLLVSHPAGAIGTTVANIRLEGDYRPEDPPPVPDASIHVMGFAQSFVPDQPLRHTTFFRVTTQGIGLNLLTGEDTILADCEIRDWHFYGLYGHGERHAVVGCRLLQHPDATRGPGERAVNDPAFRNHAEQGPVRSGYNDLAVYAQNVMRSTSGWSRWFDGFAIQPVIRSHGGPGSRAYFTENHLEGGALIVGQDATADHGHVVDAANVYVGSGETATCLGSGCARHVVRNSLFLIEDRTDPWPELGGITLFEVGRAPAPAEDGQSSAPWLFSAYANTAVVRLPESRDLSILRQDPGRPNVLLFDTLVLAEGVSNAKVFGSPDSLGPGFRPPVDAPQAKGRNGINALIDFRGAERTSLSKVGAIATP